MSKICRITAFLSLLSLLSAAFSVSTLAASAYFDHPIESEMIFLTAGTGGNCSSCNWIVAEGTITQETPLKFEVFLKKQIASGRGLPADLHLNSQGGNLIAGIKLGEIIRGYRLNTWVAKTVGTFYSERSHVDAYARNETPEAVCASACVLTFLGGVTRFAVTTHYENSIAVRNLGKLGVHQFYSDEALKEIDKKLFSAVDRSRDQLITGIMLEYVIRMGVSSELVAIASTVPPWENLHWLNDSELRSTGIETGEQKISTEIAVLNRKSASVVVRYQTADSEVTTSLFCNKEKVLMMNTEILARYKTDIASIEKWSLYDGFRLKNDGEAEPVVKRDIQVAQLGDITRIRLLFQIGNGPVDRFVGRKDFSFESESGGRYGTEAAWTLSFSLPKDFDGMNLLPRNCLLK